jgi:hypothetical protein
MTLFVAGAGTPAFSGAAVVATVGAGVGAAVVAFSLYSL